jgi:hypothetical protein
MLESSRAAFSWAMATWTRADSWYTVADFTRSFPALLAIAVPTARMNSRHGRRDNFVSTLSKLRRLALVLLVAYWIVMFVGTHVPLRSENLPMDLGRSLWGIFPMDKVLHFSGYTGLTFLMAAVWIGSQRPRWTTLLVIFLITATYAALDEWTQDWIPTRGSDPWDWVADCAGAITGLLLFTLVSPLWRRWRGEHQADKGH